MAGCCSGDVCASEMTVRYRKVLTTVLVINFGMFVIEGITGFLAGSAALQGDSLDFLNDAINYAISLYVLGMAVRWRSSAALFKGLSMGVFGIGVLGFAGWRIMSNSLPDSTTMGGIGALALAANITCTVLLFRHRDGDANRRSVWLCSRNDAIANIAVLVAAVAVAKLGQGWPDWVVGIGIAALELSSAVTIIRQALGELRDEALKKDAGELAPPRPHDS